MKSNTLINVYEIATTSGYKSVELHNADLSDFHRNLDCVVFSAFQNSYQPTPGTLIEALEDKYNISLNSLSVNPAVDLRSEFDVWLSQSINEKIQRLACIELRGWSKTVDNFDKIVNNLFALFAIMDQLDLPLKSIGLPIIGSGSQRINPYTIIPSVINGSIKGLQKIEQLKTIYLVEISDNKVALFDELMNKELNRSKEDINDMYAIDYYSTLLEEMSENINKLVLLKNTDSLSELQKKITDKSLRTFELGILSRRICEEIVDDILDSKHKKLRISLSQKISQLAKLGIASWIISYFHTIRIFGNTYAHNRAILDVYPSLHLEQDIIVLISSLNRILIFYKNYNR